MIRGSFIPLKRAEIDMHVFSQLYKDRSVVRTPSRQSLTRFHRTRQADLRSPSPLPSLHPVQLSVIHRKAGSIITRKSPPRYHTGIEGRNKSSSVLHKAKAGSGRIDRFHARLYYPDRCFIIDSILSRQRRYPLWLIPEYGGPRSAAGLPF